MFKLQLKINTDDDCRLVFRGKPFCLYEDDLEIEEIHEYLEECYGVLKEIRVLPGKAHSLIREILDKLIVDQEKEFHWGGNQKIFFKITEIDAKMPGFPEEKEWDLQLHEMSKMLLEIFGPTEDFFSEQDEERKKVFFSNKLEKISKLSNQMDNFMKLVDPEGKYFPIAKIKEG